MTKTVGALVLYFLAIWILACGIVIAISWITKLELPIIVQFTNNLMFAIGTIYSAYTIIKNLKLEE